MDLTKTAIDPNGHVAKFVFTDETSITEVVAYKYGERGVVCFSTMSGCPIGCTFCGTGKRFIRNLSSDEMLSQIAVALTWIGPKKRIQIMAMSMGEPMLNWSPVKQTAVKLLEDNFSFYISTVGVFCSEAQSEILELGSSYYKFGLQFSLHSIDQLTRNSLLGNHPLLLSLPQIRRFAAEFHKKSQKPAYFNYICTGSESEVEAESVASFIGPNHHLTCSVLCNTGDFIKADPAPALRFGQMCSERGVANWSVFDPAGQDTIGGGCGQLLFVQDFLKRKTHDQF